MQSQWLFAYGAFSSGSEAISVLELEVMQYWNWIPLPEIVFHTDTKDNTGLGL